MKSTLKITLASAILATIATGAAMSAPFDTGVFQPGFKGDIVRNVNLADFLRVVKDAKCPNGADEKFRNDILHCTVDVAQFANITCPNPSFPHYRALTVEATASERDICVSEAAKNRINSVTKINETEVKRTCDAGDALLEHSTAGFICLNSAKGIAFGRNQNLGGANPSFVKSPANDHNRNDYYDAASTTERKFKVGVDFERLPSDGSQGGRSYVTGVAIADVDGQNWRLDTTAQGPTDRYRRIIKRPVDAVLVNHQ